MNSEFLSDILECSVCLKPLDEHNKVLPCQHTFCKSCLLSIVKSHKELRCPECRVIVQQRVEDLPSNILLIRLLDGIRFQQKQNGNNENCQKIDTRRHSTDGILSESTPVSGITEDDDQTRLSTKPLYLHEHAKSDPAVTKVRSTSAKPHAVALYTYKSDEPSDLTFLKGDTIRLLKKVDQNWMSGECNGRIGVFPVNYVKILQPLPTERPYCTALYDFETDPDDPDKDCLHFSKNDRILIIRKVDENWVEGILKDKIGIFPLSFVKLNDESRKMIDDVTPTLDGSKSHRSVVSAAARRLTSKQSGKNTKKRHSFPVFNTAKNKSDPSPSSYRHSVEFGDSPLTLSSSSGDEPRLDTAVDPHPSIVDRREVLPSEVETGSVSRALPANGNPEQILNTTARSKSSEELDLSNPHDGAPSHSATKVVVAAYPYKSQKPDELDLVKGDSYVITEVCRDGWCRGSHVISGKSGAFPGNYVTPKPMSLSSSSQVGGVRHSSLAQSRDPSSGLDPNDPTPRTYEDFLNSQATKSEKHKSTSHKLPLSARLPSNTSSRSKPIPAGSKPGVASRSSPERQRPTAGRSSSTTPASGSNRASKSPPPRPVPPSFTSGMPRVRNSPRPTLQYSLSLEDKSTDSPSAISRPELPNREFQKSAIKDKKREKGFLMNFISNSGGRSKGSSKSSSPSSSSLPSSHRQTVNKPSLKVPQRGSYYATMNYPAENPEELQLHEGDEVVVHSRRPDGWFRGTNLASRDSGYFPSTFVEKIPR